MSCALLVSGGQPNLDMGEEGKTSCLANPLRMGCVQKLKPGDSHGTWWCAVGMFFLRTQLGYVVSRVRREELFQIVFGDLLHIVGIFCQLRLEVAHFSTEIRPVMSNGTEPE